jgi:prevent-host-death family protein
MIDDDDTAIPCTGSRSANGNRGLGDHEDAVHAPQTNGSTASPAFTGTAVPASGDSATVTFTGPGGSRVRVHDDAYTGSMTENTVTVREARAHLADHINRAEEGVPTVITRNGAPVAAVVPIADFEALEEAADVMLAREAEAVLAEGGPTVTMAELLADLFTEQDGDAA